MEILLIFVDHCTCFVRFGPGISSHIGCKYLNCSSRTLDRCSFDIVGLAFAGLAWHPDTVDLAFVDLEIVGLAFADSVFAGLAFAGLTWRLDTVDLAFVDLEIVGLAFAGLAWHLDTAGLVLVDLDIAD